jgi:TRAP-type C4-dicarboxylate transport system substrate-binding protein
MVKHISVLLLIALVMVLVLSGCSQPAPSSSPPPAPASSQTAPISSSTPPPATSKPAASQTPTQAEVKPIELRFSDHDPPTGNTPVKFFDPWIKEIEKAANGRIKITTYYGETLNKGTEALAAVTGGVTDITWIVHGFYPGKFPLSDVMTLPFIAAPAGTYQGRQLSAAALNGVLYEDLSETVPEVQAEYQGMKLLFNHVSIPYFLCTTKKPVRTMEDLKGMKIRELGGPPTEMWKLLGANPMLLNSTDIYDAASKGVIDGADLQWSLIKTYRFYEVFKYYTDMSTVLATFSVVMNQNTWNKLTPDLQQAIMSVSGKYGAEGIGMSAYGFQLQQDVEDAMKKGNYTMEKITLSPSESDRWKQIAGKPLWDSWVKDMNAKGLAGQKVLDATLALVKKYSQ